MSKYGVFSAPYFPAFGLNRERYFVSPRIESNVGKYGPEKTPYLDTFHVVLANLIFDFTLVLRLCHIYLHDYFFEKTQNLFVAMFFYLYVSIRWEHWYTDCIWFCYQQVVFWTEDDFWIISDCRNTLKNKFRKIINKYIFLYNLATSRCSSEEFLQ